MIVNKLLTFIIFSIFLFISSFAIYSDISSIQKDTSNTEHVSAKFKQILTLKELIHELQKERGLTNIYYSKNNQMSFQLLKHQREMMDKVLILASSSDISKDIIEARIGIDNGELSQTNAFNTYTNLILSMLLETKKLLLFINDQDIKNHFIIYQNSNFVQEYLGQLRAEIGGITAKQTLSNKQYISIIELQTLVKNYINQNKENIKLTDAHITPPVEVACFHKTLQIIQKIINQDTIQDINISPMEWFNRSTCAIDSIDKTMSMYITYIKSEIDHKLKNQKSKLYYHIIFWTLALLVSIILSIILYKTNKRMLEKQKLLEDYKKAIDNSTIVSKTDKTGKITYANKAFCDISGYKLSELLGKPHSIVRHPSVEKAAFKDLWDTIQSGKTWNGQIPNLAKDKSTYWVDASISPIYDDEENLVEYIAIRHDITEIIELNKEIKNTQYELIYRMGESVESRSKESGHHIQRVAHYSKLLAIYYGLSNQEADTIFIASTMHDMGKIAIPDSILLKKDKLDNNEWEIMKTHSAIGYKILAGSNLPILKMAADIAYEHHEHYNGNGYPRGIKGEDISIHARIVAIADVFDALISERVYKKAWPLNKVIRLFEEESGTQFDPKLVELFLEHTDEFIKIKTQFED